MILRVTTKNENVAQPRLLVSGFSLRSPANAASQKATLRYKNPISRGVQRNVVFELLISQNESQLQMVKRICQF